jgi:hypothetical protein
MKYLIPLFLIIILLSCGNDNSELYLILRDENKELFDKNNELVQSIEKMKTRIEMKIDSMETRQMEFIRNLDDKIMKKQKQQEEIDNMNSEEYTVTIYGGGGI